MNIAASIGVGLGLWCHVLHNPVVNFYLKKTEYIIIKQIDNNNMSKTLVIVESPKNARK